MNNPLAKYFTIEKRSHHFLITHVQGRAREVIEAFAKSYIEYSFKRVQGRWVKEAEKIWASRTHDKREYRFHINQYDKFIAHLENVGLNSMLYNVTEKAYYEALDTIYPVRERFKAREEQVPAIEYLASLRPPVAKMLEIPTGAGKDQPLDAKILTPSGWSTMGEMHVGMPIVAPDGSYSSVEGVYPQGPKEVFRVTFEDGRSTETGRNHIWSVRTVNCSEWFEVKTDDIENIFDQGVYIPLRRPSTWDTYVQDVAKDSFNVVMADQVSNETGFYLVLKRSDVASPTGTGGFVDHRAVNIVITQLRSLGCIAHLVLPGMIKVETDDVIKLTHFFNRETYQLHRLDRILTVPGLRLKSIAPSRIVETQCISVLHHSCQYITDDYIVTHNTFCALKACSMIGKRIVAILKPGYIDKWTSDFKEIYDVDDEDLWIIGGKKADSGSKPLKALLNAATSGTLTAKIIVISSRTMQNWFCDYNSMTREVYEYAGWPCAPDQLYELLNAGVRLIDEAHQEFHLGFMIDLFTHIPMSISLSATMISDNTFLTQMYELVYPKKSRYDKIPLVRYIHSYAWRYRFESVKGLKCKGYGGSYSHNEFEKSILASKAMTKSYLELIERVTRLHYLEDEYERGDKCLIYCSSIDMCEAVTKHLSQTLKVPGTNGEKFDVRRYVGSLNDPYENLMDAEISVSTLGSAGTGHDISGLTTVVMTHAITSSQSNIQGFGRLRNKVGRRMKFAYFVCQDIDKQMQYHQEKTELLRKRALTHEIRDHMSMLLCS